MSDWIWTLIVLWVSVVAAIFIFWALRSFFLWYFRINEARAHEERIIELLEELNGRR